MSIKYPVIPVVQPIGEFFICALPYSLVQEVAKSEPAILEAAKTNEHGIYKLSGNQREETISRRKEIGNYISTIDATFPNTIILAANIAEDDGFLSDDDDARWFVKYNDDCNTYELHIPTRQAVARIIDGQHRVRGFEHAPAKPARFDLPCAVFLELSMPEQATMFSTINSNQKKVDRSLAYNLFAYNLDNEPSESWEPEKLAVFFTRRLSVEAKSPLQGRIKVIARNGRSVLSDDQDWCVSTSIIVDGIMALFASKPMHDRDTMRQKGATKKLRSLLPSDRSPLRQFYIQNEDKLIYTIVYNYFDAVSEKLFTKPDNGFITKTIGIQALFDFLKHLSPLAVEHKDISKLFFSKYLSKLATVNFNNDRLKQANAQGRRLHRDLFLFANNIPTPGKLTQDDEKFFQELLDRG